MFKSSLRNLFIKVLEHMHTCYFKALVCCLPQGLLQQGRWVLLETGCLGVKGCSCTAVWVFCSLGSVVLSGSSGGDGLSDSECLWRCVWSTEKGMERWAVRRLSEGPQGILDVGHIMPQN